MSGLDVALIFAIAAGIVAVVLLALRYAPR
jgi:hypothetical protein